MKIFYLSKSTINFIIVIAFLLMLLFSFYILLIYLLLVSLFLFLFRRKFIFFKEDQVTTAGTIYAPVSGKISEIKTTDDQKTEISIKMNLLSGYGIYLPISGRFNNVSFNNKEHGNKVTIEDRDNRKIRLFFINSIFKRNPELVVLPGDLGRRQVDFGFYPFGATVKMELDNVQSLVKLHEKVRGGETIIGRYNEESHE
ncbi:hypothetical protein [Halobacteriovorax sp. BALOs_7]|uniref:hypothetical protein n=1 Tax=unclassified Halobacteriovorax TaxID=2639665 RepID=UPI0013C4EE90|nr:hypothetical protein [Halobacteriovorax sp. BALOs_7]